MEWWTLFTSNYEKVAIAAPRGHAKSTACTLTYLLAELLWRTSSYALIVSDTTTQACQFLGDVKKELAENDILRSLFKIESFTKDTEDDVIVLMEDGHQFRVSAKGAEQKLRGLKWDHKRPDLILCDDLENDEIVMNKDRRDKFKRWFYGALIPSKSIKGKIRIVGTILHEDSLLSNLMPKYWDKLTRSDELKTWSVGFGRDYPWKAVKYKAHNEDFSAILWQDRYDEEFFRRLKADFMDRGIPDVYSQEILNEPIDESVAYFKRSDLHEMSRDDQKKRMNYYVTADLAISQEEAADYSVFMVAGIDENRILHVVNIIRDRLDGREIVDILMALHKTYDPEIIGIEEMQVSKSIGPFLKEEMVKTGIYPNIKPLQHRNKDKIQRARSIQARLRAGGVRFDKESDWYPVFEDELIKFPRGRKDDQVDAFAYLGMVLDTLIEAPTAQDIEDEEYNNEFQSSGLSDAGRNEYTGY